MRLSSGSIFGKVIAVHSFVMLAGLKAGPSVCAPTPKLKVIPASAHAARTNEVLDPLEIEKPEVIKLIFMSYFV